MARPGGCEFSVVGVLIVPTVVSTVWFVVMGGTAIDFQLNGVADMAGSPGQQRREHPLRAARRPACLDLHRAGRRRTHHSSAATAIPTANNAPPT
jgi:hypothetical protein